MTKTMNLTLYPAQISVKLDFGLNVSPDEVIERTLSIMGAIPWFPVVYKNHKSTYDYHSGCMTITFSNEEIAA